MASWPYLSECRSSPHALASKGPQLVVHHEFVSVDDGFLCVSCFCFGRSLKRMSKLRSMQCKPVRSHTMLLLRQAFDHGHKLQHVTFLSGRPIFACTRCGRYASRQFRALLRPCSGGRPKAHSWHRLFRKQIHPTAKVPVLSTSKIHCPAVWNPELVDAYTFGNHVKQQQSVPHCARPNCISVCPFDDPEAAALSESD